MPNSSLAAMYNQCKMCANTTLIAFQDKNGFVQIGNLTSEGWALTQLGPALDPEMGTGLALQPFYRNGLADRINLYYQKSNLSMNLASWRLASANNGSLSIVPLSYLLLILESQWTAGPLTSKLTTSSRPAHPSPRLPPIPTSPRATKPGSKSCFFPIKVLKSILGREPKTIGRSNICILR